MSPPNTQHRRAYAAILAFHTSRATGLSGHREENDTTATNTSPSTTSRSNEERIRSNARSVLNVQSVTTPLRPVTATTSYSRTSSSSASNYTSTVSMRSDGSHHPVLRNLVAIASRGRAALQNSSSNPNNLHHLTSSSSSSSTSSHRSSTAHNGPPAIHPQFRSKAVCKLTCSACIAVVCSRGMKAILLADTRVELYSTDTPPIGVQLVNDDYMTRNCRCRIRDVACLGCGSVVGYHVTTPCNTCLDACNNGHFWMFHAEGIHSSNRMDETGTKTLLWATIPCAERDIEGLRKLREFLCR